MTRKEAGVLFLSENITLGIAVGFLKVSGFTFQVAPACCWKMGGYTTFRERRK